MAARDEGSEPLWDRIDRNRGKVAFYVAAFIIAWAAGVEVAIVLPVAVIVAWAGAVGGRIGPFWPVMAWGGAIALVAGGVWAAVATTRSDRSVLAQLGAVRVPTGALPDTTRALGDMAVAAGLDYPPPLFVLDAWGVNAFVVGRRPETAAVGITTGMLKAIPPDEQRAVFANLMARLRDGDVFVATVAASLMSPAWAWRSHDLDAKNDVLFEPSEPVEEQRRPGEIALDPRQGLAKLQAMFFGIAFLGVFVTELLYGAQMQEQILTSEAADAKAMLLLKDPRDMLAALEHVVPADNIVETAGSALAPLFFSWTGTAYIGDEDPEMRRVRRLRETLGAAAADTPGPGGV